MNCTVRSKKIYIGSYRSEKEAAIAFDFYCILHHSLKAKTNFSYTKDCIINMIAGYLQNHGCFTPIPENLSNLNI